MNPIPKHRKKPPPVILAAPKLPAVPVTLIVATNAPEAIVAKLLPHTPILLSAAAVEPEAPAAKVAAARCAHLAGPTHLEGIVINIVGITVCNQGHSCEEHPYCGEIIDNDVVAHLRRVQVIMPSKNGGPGQEVTAVAVYWVTNGIDHCRVGFLPHHMGKYATR